MTYKCLVMMMCQIVKAVASEIDSFTTCRMLYPDVVSRVKLASTEHAFLIPQPTVKSRNSKRKIAMTWGFWFYEQVPDCSSRMNLFKSCHDALQSFVQKGEFSLSFNMIERGTKVWHQIYLCHAQLPFRSKSLLVCPLWIALQLCDTSILKYLQYCEY